MSPQGIKAAGNLKKLVDQCKTSCTYEIIDILENPQIAEQEKVLATPLLVQINSNNTKRIVGDLDDTQKILSQLNIN